MNYNPNNFRALSETCTRYIHYPPGTCFQYNKKTFVVVDDLGDMYRSKACTQALVDQDYELQTQIDENDSTWEKIRNRFDNLRLEIPIKLL